MLLREHLSPEQIKTIGIDRDDRTGLITISITLNKNLIKLSELSEKLDLPKENMERIGTAAGSIPIIKLLADNIDKVYIFE